MRKTKISKIVSFCLAFLFMFSLVILPKTNLAKAVIETAQIKAGQMTNKTTNTPSEYHIANHYSYRLDKALTKTPDTVEAWLNVPANSTGGVILSNYIGGDAIGNHKHIDYSVDVSGRVRLDWDGTIIVFNKGFVADGKWHHIAVVRNTNAASSMSHSYGRVNTVTGAKSNTDAKKKLPVSSFSLLSSLFGV